MTPPTEDEMAAAPVVLPPKPPQQIRSRNQLRATAGADRLAAKAKWKALTPEATMLWGKVHSDELAKVEGNFHKMAGLVQMRYGISREESDQQVRAFFAKHYPAA